MSEALTDEVIRYFRQQAEIGVRGVVLPPGTTIDGVSNGIGDIAAARTPAERVVAPVADESAGADVRTLDDMRSWIGECTRCELSENRKQVVFGVGNPDADLMFIGEAPGADEDRLGEPFVGKAGQLLDKILAAAGITREEVYIANIVKCRPPGNRDPKPTEVFSCNAFMLKQIEIIRPKLLCALGRFAAQTLLGDTRPLGRLRGKWWEWNGKKLICTYHPAACLRNQDYKRPVWNDIQMLRDAYREIRPV